MNSPQSPNIGERIVDLVQEFWDQHQTPLLLSKLGGQDGGEVANRAKLESGSLARYLGQELADRVRVIRHSSNAALIGAVPTAIQIAIHDIDAALEKTNRPSTRYLPRFSAAFWAAFRVPLEESKTRHLLMREPIRFQDSDSTDQPSDSIEITRDYIVGHDAEKEEVEQKIRDWLADNQLQQNDFLSNSNSVVTELPSDDLLGRLVVALEPSELRRMSVPMDIVSKLRRHRT